MYLFLPFLFFWTRRRRGIWTLAGLWALSVILASVQPHVHLLQRLSILRFLPNFLPGVIAFALPIRPHLRSFCWPLFILGIVGVYTLWPTDAVGWGLCLLLGLLIPLFGKITSLCVRSIAGEIATYSYGIYLSHQFCIWLAFSVWATHPLWQKVLMFLILLSGIPVVLYHTIERPMIRVGTRITLRWWEPAKATAPKKSTTQIATEPLHATSS